MAHIIVMLIKPCSDHLFAVDGGIVSLEETPPIRMEMIHLRLKLFTPDGCVFIGVE